MKISARYIERFRYGRPQSRGERQKLAVDGADDQPFWWMSSNPSQPSSSTPTRTSKECFGGVLQWKALVSPQQHTNVISLQFFRVLFFGQFNHANSWVFGYSAQLLLGSLVHLCRILLSVCRIFYFFFKCQRHHDKEELKSILQGFHVLWIKIKYWLSELKTVGYGSKLVCWISLLFLQDHLSVEMMAQAACKTCSDIKQTLRFLPLEACLTWVHL